MKDWRHDGSDLLVAVIDRRLGLAGIQSPLGSDWILLDRSSEVILQPVKDARDGNGFLELHWDSEPLRMGGFVHAWEERREWIESLGRQLALMMGRTFRINEATLTY